MIAIFEPPIANGGRAARLAGWLPHLSQQSLQAIEDEFRGLSSSVDRYSIPGQSFADAYKAAKFKRKDHRGGLVDTLYKDSYSATLLSSSGGGSPYWKGRIEQYGLDSHMCQQLRDASRRDADDIADTLSEAWEDYFRNRFFENLASD